MLLDAASHTPSPWLGPWTVLAAATGARNGELCGLKCRSRTGRRHHPVPPGAYHHRPSRPSRRRRPRGRRKELAVGPVKSAASSAMLTLPPFAVQALRQHRRQQAASASPAGAPDGNASKGRTRPAAPAGPAGPGVPHRAGHAGQPQPRQPRLRPPRRQRRAGGPSHMLRHALASAMAANKEPASIIAAQLRHADGGASPSGSTSTSSPRPRPGWPG